MINIPITLYWQAGSHGHDGGEFEDDLELEIEEYREFKKLKMWEKSIEEIKDGNLKNILEEKTEDMSYELYRLMIDDLMDNYRENCLIDEDSPLYDPEDEEEQFSEDPYEWFTAIYRQYFEFSADEDDLINLENEYLDDKDFDYLIEGTDEKGNREIVARKFDFENLNECLEAIREEGIYQNLNIIENR